jgi:N-acetylmuramoyl-L-alanine amidase
MAKVYINAGHGRRAKGTRDPGAVGPTGLQEHDVVLDLAARVGHLLRAQGVRTLGGQTEWRGDAVRAANAAGVGLFLCLHCNAAGTGTAKGVETWYHPDDESKAMAARVQNAIVVRLRGAGPNALWLKVPYHVADRGLKEAGDGTRAGAVLRACQTPAILCELLFISNAAEENLLRQATVKQEIAQAIADAVGRQLRGE